MLVGKAVFPDPEAQARIMYGIITGLGFIGGGAISKTSSEVAGTATIIFENLVGRMASPA
ncbi:hypothetical protein [Allohahella sp. A8]|uniref:hypothetical protein n=1 Tax=Allohahella sp. A8 TaxID=3141461 RepID=UPI003A80BD65